MLPLFQEKLWAAKALTGIPLVKPVPADKAQLMGRISSDPFDGGRSATWMTALQNPTYMALQDVEIGHTIHVVSDRAPESLKEDLQQGLQLMKWLTKRPVTWYWWDQPWKRSVPAGTDPGRDHVNGGWAIPGIPEVHVYRREEAHKVMLHECIHALGLDVDSHLVAPVLKQFEGSLGRRLWPHLGEAYTELYAELLWSVASATSLKRAKEAWAYQLVCSEKQAAQVWARIYDSTEDENTNIFAYYVLKWVLMQHSETVFFQKNASVGHWFSWWLQRLPLLTTLAKKHAASEHKELPMGMTCSP